MSENNQLYCRIWAIEQDPRNGSAHWCHAGSTGLKGNVYSKESIDKVLEEKPTQIETMEWRLVRCQPTHDSLACDSCQYKPYIDAPGYFHD